MDRKEIRRPSEIKINEYTLEEILERCYVCKNMYADLRCADLSGANLRHANLSKANLSCADLSGADLSKACLYYADLRRADLSGANLFGADLSKACLYYADLRRADLSKANLRCAYLSGADLSKACLYYADLRRADLSGANLFGADLSKACLFGASNVPYITLACPSDGAFTAWKKVGDYLIKLEIPASAKRCSATTRKCRASKAKVLGIYTLDGKKTGLKNLVNNCLSIINQRPELNYVVGETVYPDSFDENRWNECSHGIHFFIDKQDAINY